MNRLLMLAALAVLLGLAPAARAQSIFSKKPRPNPSQRVPELILLVKTDADERKRASAAEELREFDARTYSEIIPVLTDVLQHDTKASVRLEALNSLSRLRPVSQPAGAAIENAVAHDESWRVRLQAKSALVRYQLAGYSPPKTASTSGSSPRVTTSTEPPLAAPTPPAPRPTPPITTAPARNNPAPAPFTIEVEGPTLPMQR